MSPAVRRQRRYVDSILWLSGLCGAIFKPRPRSRIWPWLDSWVKVPESSGGPNPGQLRTGRFPIFRGLFDLVQQRGVHFLTLCSSARAGKTLFSICLVLYWIAERFGAVVWLDPTRNSARKLVRDELDQFLLDCAPVRALAIITKSAWTTLEKCFRGKGFRIVGSGAEADLHGFNAELAIGNELDACRASTEADAASLEKIIARTKLLTSSRLVAVNSTPQKGEFGPTWLRFLSGTQHHCYVPGPHCTDARAKRLGIEKWQADPETVCRPGWSALSYDPRLAGWQRFTFFSEKVPVPFDEELNPLVDENGDLFPRIAWREEVTGQASFERFGIYEQRPALSDPTRLERVRVGWNLKGVRRGTTYQCAHCKGEIEQVDQGWMLARYRWMSHNPDFIPDRDKDAPEGIQPIGDDHISAHVWSWYSPFEKWGIIAAEFLEAKGNLGLLIKFWVYTLGRPFIREGSAIKSDDLDRVIARCPVGYVQGQLPLEPEILTITVDKQGASFWFVIRAWGVMWDHPERRSWSALVDWGEAASFKMVLEKYGRIPDERGHLRRFTYRLSDGTLREPSGARQTAEGSPQGASGGERQYMVAAGLVDCGFEQQAVFDLCLPHAHWLSPSKGGDGSKTGFNPIRETKVMDDQLLHLWFWSDHFAAEPGSPFSKWLRSPCPPHR